jgi:hypothetical protein
MVLPAKETRDSNTTRPSADVEYLARQADEAQAKAALARALDDGSGVDWGTIYRVGHLVPLVKAHAQPGSNLAKSFALYGAHSEGEWITDSNFARGESLAQDAWVEWLKLEPAQRAFIGEGWHAPREYPTLAEAAVDDAACGANVMWALCVDAGAMKEVDIYARFVPDDEDLTLVQLRVRQWAEKAPTIKAARDAVDALEARWEEAVAMDEKGGIGVRRRAEPRAAGMLASPRRRGCRSCCRRGR